MLYLEGTNASVFYVETPESTIKPVMLVGLTFENFAIDADSADEDQTKIEFIAEEGNIKILAEFFTSLAEELKIRNAIAIPPIGDDLSTPEDDLSTPEKDM